MFPTDIIPTAQQLPPNDIRRELFVAVQIRYRIIISVIPSLP